MSIKKGKRLLDEVKDIMRLKHYSIHRHRNALIKIYYWNF